MRRCPRMECSMEYRSDELPLSEVAESPSLLVSLGNAVDLTLGEGGTGNESKRYEYN
ncbi:MAG: albusnodin family lasso peptide [Pseudonocardiales bacterium]